MSYILDRDSAVSLISRGNKTAEYSVNVSDELRIGEVPHGGYVLVTLLSAVAEYFRDTGKHPHPVSVTGYYLKATTRGTPGKISVEELKSGRLSLARAVLSQPEADGKWTERTMCLATFGNLSQEKGPTRLLDLHNPVAPRDKCLPDPMIEMMRSAANQTGPDGKPRMTANMRLLDEQLLDPFTPFPDPTKGDPVTGRAEARCWVRSRDGRPADWKSLVVYSDATPVVFRYGLDFICEGQQAWFPTVELRIDFKAMPSPETRWIAQATKCRALVNGRHENDVELWEEGVNGGEPRLLAIAREMALVVPAAVNLRKGKKPDAQQASL